MEEEIRCSNPECHKLFAVKLRGDILITPSTEIRFEPSDDSLRIEITCSRNWCKRRTTILFK